MGPVADVTERTATFQPRTSSPRQARQLVSAELHEGGAASDREIAALLTSELATNAVRHAGTEFTVTVRVQGGVLSVSVADRSPDHPVAPSRMPDTDVRSGRGLVLVSTYATEWGVERSPDGKVVWFTLALR